MALEINTAGIEFVKVVISLYRSSTYYREKDVLAKGLLEHSIEAGRLATELSVCHESQERGYAIRALEELSKAMFALKVMGEEGVYPARKVQPVAMFGEELKELLKLYLTENRYQQPPEYQQAPQYQEPSEPEPEQVPESEVKQIPMSADNVDTGGFNEIYTGKL